MLKYFDAFHFLLHNTVFDTVVLFCNLILFVVKRGYIDQQVKNADAASVTTKKRPNLRYI